MSRCATGLFLKAQLHSSYIFALNNKPFRSGGFFQHKRDMLKKFVADTSPENPWWDAFREKIALDLGRELSGDEHEIENMLAGVAKLSEREQLRASSSSSSGPSRQDRSLQCRENFLLCLACRNPKPQTLNREESGWWDHEYVFTKRQRKW